MDRLKTIQAVVDRMLRVGQAAERLGLSWRQMERLVERYTAEGLSGLVACKRESRVRASLCADPLSTTAAIW